MFLREQNINFSMTKIIAVFCVPLVSWSSLRVKHSNTHSLLIVPHNLDFLEDESLLIQGGAFLPSFVLPLMFSARFLSTSEIVNRRKSIKRNYTPLFKILCNTVGFIGWRRKLYYSSHPFFTSFLFSTLLSFLTHLLRTFHVNSLYYKLLGGTEMSTCPPGVKYVIRVTGSWRAWTVEGQGCDSPIQT